MADENLSMKNSIKINQEIINDLKERVSKGYKNAIKMLIKIKQEV